jgi:hypothetical protein
MIVDKKTLENMEKSLNKTNLKRGKDYSIQGLQLQRGYIEHWDVIKGTSKEYGVDMNRLGPVITKQAYEQIIIAKNLTEQIKNNKKLREIASSCTFPIRSIFYDSDDPSKAVDGVIFLMVFRALSDFCICFSEGSFRSYLKNGNSEPGLKKLFSTKGVTIKDTERDIKEAVKIMIEEIKKWKKKSYKVDE